jgi:hypothetical protein
VSLPFLALGGDDAGYPILGDDVAGIDDQGDKFCEFPVVDSVVRGAYHGGVIEREALR